MNTNDANKLRGLGAQVQGALNAFIESDDIASYKELQTRLRHLQIVSSKDADTLCSFRLQVIENAAIAMLIEMGVLDALVAKDGADATAADLAAATDYNELVIARLMRVVCALFFCEETDESTYRATHITSLLVEPGWKGGLRWMEIFYGIVGDIRNYVSSTSFGRIENKPSPTAFEFSNGRTLWKVLEEKPDQRRNFDLWMRERRKHEESLWHIHFPPCTSLSDENLKTDSDIVLMVDIGGANGSQAINFKAQFPHLPGRYVVQDLFLSNSGEAIKNLEGVEMMTHDFFTPQPIKGARYYYFRNVFHNWQDEKSVEILRNVVPAMDPEYSSLLIDDYVLPTQRARLHGAVEDILMMVSLNALERTAKQYEGLLRAAGLEIVNIFPAGTNEEAVIEARIAKQQAS